MADRRSVTRGQSLVEFALILPVLLTLVGAVADVARLYSAWVTLEAATRDAAEYAATNATTASDALADARSVVCAQASGLAGYVGTPGDPDSCTQPSVSLVSFGLSATAPGASTNYPIATVTVQVVLPFQTLFPYPLFTQNGAWSLGSTRTYSIVQGR